MEDTDSNYHVLINPIQQRNPILKLIRSVPWLVSDIIPDFVITRTSCCLFLSIQYHLLHPDYIHQRIKGLDHQYQLRLLLVLVDIQDGQNILNELAKIALSSDMTLLVSWSNDEAARYIESYKIYQNKPPDAIMSGRNDMSSSLAIEFLTSIKKINKTDASSLIDIYGSLNKIITADKQGFALVPGMGPTKAEKLYRTFHEPFINEKLT